MKKILIFLVSITVILLLSACGGGSGSSGSSISSGETYEELLKDLKDSGEFEVVKKEHIDDFKELMIWKNDTPEHYKELGISLETLYVDSDYHTYEIGYGGEVPSDTTGLTLNGDIKTLEDELAPIAEKFLLNLGTMIDAGSGIYIKSGNYAKFVGYRSLLFSLIKEPVDSKSVYQYTIHYGENELIMLSYSYDSSGELKNTDLAKVFETESFAFLLKPLDKHGNPMLVLLGFPDAYLQITKGITGEDLDLSSTNLKKKYPDKHIFYDQDKFGNIYWMDSSTKSLTKLTP